MTDICNVCETPSDVLVPLPSDMKVKLVSYLMSRSPRKPYSIEVICPQCMICFENVEGSLGTDFWKLYELEIAKPPENVTPDKKEEVSLFKELWLTFLTWKKKKFPPDKFKELTQCGTSKKRKVIKK